MVLQNRLAMVLRHLLIIAPIGAKRQGLLTERLPYGRGRHHRGFAGDFPRVSAGFETDEDILRTEYVWMEKLQSRRMGINGNPPVIATHQRQPPATAESTKTRVAMVRSP
jgi:hypothetical protein